MDNIMATLGPEHVAVDLGCGSGSFRYSSYRCRIVGIDSAFGEGPRYSDLDRTIYVRAASHQIPLPNQSVDAIICNHSLEHIVEYRNTLSEMKRILKPAGVIWISVPNGFGFDDWLYRLLYAGGGHVNRFSFHALQDSVESSTGLHLLQWTTLASGFVYCNRLSQEVRSSLPLRLRVLTVFGLNMAVCLFLNASTRLIDRIFNTRFNVYGWGFVFGPANTNLPPLLNAFNVCYGCGSGNISPHLQPYKYFGIKLYRCPQCRQPNPYFSPPEGFQ
jgi:hypothetical protein